MAFVSKRDTIGQLMPCDRVVTLKKTLSTFKGDFEANTPVLLTQEYNADGCSFQVLSKDAEARFSLHDFIESNYGEMWKHTDEIKAFADSYFAVNDEKTAAFQKKMNRTNIIVIAICFAVIGMIFFFTLYANLQLIENNNGFANLSKPFQRLYLITIPAIPTILFLILTKKGWKELSKEFNEESKAEVFRKLI